jgi:hypothetical protein
MWYYGQVLARDSCGMRPNDLLNEICLSEGAWSTVGGIWIPSEIRDATFSGLDPSQLPPSEWPSTSEAYGLLWLSFALANLSTTYRPEANKLASYSSYRFNREWKQATLNHLYLRGSGRMLRRRAHDRHMTDFL